MNLTKHLLVHKLFLLCWSLLVSGVIGYFCLTESSSLPAVNVPNIDKIVHFCFHFGFTISWILFFKKELNGAGDAKAYLVSFVFSVLFGITIEVMQSVYTTTRVSDVTDILANTLGALFAVFMAVVFKERLNKI
jgi:VanZ family protein